MDFFDAFHTSASGLTAQKLRMNLISSNLANICMIPLQIEANMLTGLSCVH